MPELADLPRGLLSLLDDHLPDGLQVLPEIEVTTSASFPPSVRDPDIVVIRDRAFKRRSVRVPAIDVVLVVEIVSPGSRGMDHVMKVHEYAQAGDRSRRSTETASMWTSRPTWSSRWMH